MEREILLSKTEIQNNYSLISKPGTYRVKASGTANVTFDSNLGLDVQLINVKAIPAPLLPLISEEMKRRGDNSINLADTGRGKRLPNFTLVFRNILNNGDNDKIRKPLKNEDVIIQVDYARNKEGELVRDNNGNAIMNVIDFTFVNEASKAQNINLDDAPHPAEAESEELINESQSESEEAATQYDIWNT